MNEHEIASSGNDDPAKQQRAISRRAFFCGPAAVATSIALPAIFGNPLTAQANGLAVPGALAPRYLPVDNFVPQVDIKGKIAVITGASRGIGRATAEELVSLGVKVVGTSRNPKRVPNPPTTYPLFELDIADANSVKCFADDVKSRLKKVDILINNAGRFVLGNIVPPKGTSPRSHLEQLQLGMDTLCNGHIHVTHEILPLMPTSGYARLLFTTSIAAYLVGGTEPLTPFIQGYVSAKRALLAYANSLRGMLLQSQSNIQVSTVNPYFIATAGAEHPNPIYTERVLNNGFTDRLPTPTPFNQFLAFIRQRQAAGLPASFVGQAYSQLLRSSSPPANVAVASTTEPFATQGGTQFIESVFMAENAQAAIGFQTP
jgi:NAD(P)-dependent dehydrogenase (short-subunit alcohol dehydrogenase family)